MKVFADTNVLVSAFATRGLCADLFAAVLLEHELLVGEVVLTELRRVLRDRIRLPRPALQEIEQWLRQATVVPRPARHLDLGIADRDDEWIVASAVAGQADVLVTGDADLLALGSRSPVRVLSPRALWQLLHGEPAGG